VLDIEHERDIERLRRLAMLQKSQLEHLVAVLARKCAELAKLKGGEDELQLTLKLLEDAQKQVAEADALVGRGRDERNGEKKDREPQAGHGPMDQLALERVSLLCELDDADRVCPSCERHLEPLKGQTERSEMIDVVELKYQVVQVERQKYVCKCGSVVETAPGPERAMDGGRYSLRFALKVAFDKYVAHLPLERQARLMGHAGPRDHLADVVGPVLGGHAVAGAGLRWAFCTLAGWSSHRRRPDRLARSGGQDPATLADVVPHRARLSPGAEPPRAREQADPAIGGAGEQQRSGQSTPAVGRAAQFLRAPGCVRFDRISAHAGVVSARSGEATSPRSARTEHGSARA
jgi:transposase